MTLKFKKVLLIAVLTTLIALITSFVALPNNSGYAGLFFIVISPIFIGIFILWTYILLSAFKRIKMLKSIAAYHLNHYPF